MRKLCFKLSNAKIAMFILVPLISVCALVTLFDFYNAQEGFIMLPNARQER